MAEQKTLTLVRHAHAEPERPGLKDFDRALSERGLEEARIAARKFAHTTPSGLLLLSSPAKRALETAHIFAEILGVPPDRVATDERLYLASPAEFLTVIAAVDNSVKHLVLFSHNPGISRFARQLSGQHQMGELNTAAVFSLEVAGWKDLG